MTDVQLRKKLEEHLEELPVLPQAVVSLMALDPADEGFFEELLEILRLEPNYTARVLAMANSAASGSHAPIMTPKAALARIGARGAAGLVLALAVTRVFVPRDDWEKSLWRHSLQVAAAARELARAAKDPECNPEEAYTCGLLHDIGRFVLFQEGPEILRRVDEGGWDDPAGLLAMEASICGLTHSDLGALACERWGLPNLLRQCIRTHHKRPPAEPRGPLQKLTAVVQAADFAMFPSAVPGADGFDVADEEVLRAKVQRHLPPFVTLGIDELRDLIRRASSEASAAAEALGLG